MPYSRGTSHGAETCACRDRIEEEIIRGYGRLALMPDPTTGHRTIVLGRFGALEVRLTEIDTGSCPSPIPPFWVEVYSHACGSVVDSCGCFEFDEDELGDAVEVVIDAHRRQPRLN